MCGKFTAMASWAEVVAFSQPLTRDEKDADREVAYRVMTNLPVIVFDKEAGKRRVVPMRWGFPDPSNWRRPQPIHARSETIDKMPAFADAFSRGQRGIVLMKTFNEAPDVDGPTIQHTITPGDEPALFAAFVWRQFRVESAPDPIFCCVLCTVPANELVASLPAKRMPAFLAAEDWGKWLGEEEVPLAEVKACLKTVEGVRWNMTKEERARKGKRQKPTVSDPGGLF